MKEIKVALLGFGGIARSHKHAYELFEREGTPIRLVAICDVDPSQFEKESSINLGHSEKASLEGIHLYTDSDDLLEKEEFDLVDICLPTYLHCEYTVKMLKAGKHVQCEKPMALSSRDCDLMIRTAKECGKKLMIGQCLRFEPNYLYLKDCIDDARFGRVRYADFTRLSAPPRWGFQGWFRKTECSGGCALDMHIHDIDMARFLFGEPLSVSATGYHLETKWQYIDSRLNYRDLPVRATGSWDEAATFPFTSAYRVRFERATVLFENHKVTVYPEKGEPFSPEIIKKNRMAEEIRYLCRTISDESFVNTVNPPESARDTVLLVELLRDSFDQNGKEIIP